VMHESHGNNSEQISIPPPLNCQRSRIVEHMECYQSEWRADTVQKMWVLSYVRNCARYYRYEEICTSVIPQNTQMQ